MELKINQELKPGFIATAFGEKRRIQIQDFLQPEGAEGLYQCLVGGTPWLTAYRDRGKDHMISEDQLRDMPPREIQEMQNRIWTQARDEFEFMYGCYPLMDEDLRKKNPNLFLYCWVDFINSEGVLAFIREITGVKSLIRADAQATWYRKGQFLTLHNDYDPSDEGKRVAYVMSLSRDWSPDWGGILQFYDDDFKIEDGYLPRFNALSLFLTPQSHSVSYVTPFCGNKRLSITGWFRDQ